MARTRFKPWDDVYGWVFIALGCGLVLLFFGYQSCSVSDVTMDIGGTPRDVRCHALIGDRGWLYALLAILPPAITMVAGLVKPLRRVTMAACIATTVVLLSYVIYLVNAPGVTLLP